MTCYTFLYTRRSSEEDDRQALSLAAQDTECREYALRHAIAINEVVAESHSARRPGRPLFSAMLERISELRAKSVPVCILCHKPDRLLRNLTDWARISDLLEDGLELRFVTGSFENNAQGRMSLNMNFVWAKYYVDNLSEEVKKGLRAKLARGEWPGSAPLGYVNANRRIEVDPLRSPLLRRAFELYATGEYSLDALRHQLERWGLRGRRRGKPITKSLLRDNILSNPFYCGLLRYRGRVYPGSHEPIISAALFERVQAVLAGKTLTKPYRHEFRYRGLLRCARCGCTIVGDMKKQKYVYYRCSHRRGPCPEGYVRAELLDDAIYDSLVSTLTLPPGVADALREAADQLVVQDQQGQNGNRTLLERRIKELEHMEASLLDLRLLGQIDETRYNAKQNELIQQQHIAREQLHAFELAAPDPREVVNRFIATGTTVGEAFREGTDAEIRELLRIVGSNYQLRGRKVDFEPVEPFTLAAQARNRPVWRPQPDDVRRICSAATLSGPPSH